MAIGFYRLVYVIYKLNYLQLFVDKRVLICNTLDYNTTRIHDEITTIIYGISGSLNYLY